ncbi:MAG: flagellar hook-basal body complex protein, partial [Deltaproteobacteria bacterium]|nr:flagellar hook-basal body complex protein [Deltaproteobacteria bacterium]
MSLSASMYSGTSGLKVHGEGMTVIGNNISNVSTVGFKASTMQFEDALSQQISTAAGIGQIGRGAAIGVVRGDFSQGSVETTTSSTDLSIGGNGFFVVSPVGQEVSYYTRAGNFTFDQDGFLVDTHGYRVQGWEVLQEDSSVAASGDSTMTEQTGVKIAGVPQDIKLNNFQSPPQATSRVDMIVNVDSQSADKVTNDGLPPLSEDPLNGADLDGSPLTALFDTYDATSAEGPIGDDKYAYQSTIKVYDENGTAHNLTVYMDPVEDPDVVNSAGGKRYWEYIVTVPVNEDNREFWGAQPDQSKRGILMAGTMTYNSAGEMENMSAFTINNPYDGTGGVAPIPSDPGPPAVAPVEGTFATDASRIENWTPANFSQNGYPICTANFLGSENGSITATDKDALTANVPPKDETLDANSKSKNIEINFGIRNKSTDWIGGEDNAGKEGLNNLAELQGLLAAVDGGSYDSVADGLKAINGIASPEISALASTNYSTGSTTIFQSQDGYTAGFLQNISVDRDGVITGNYSNGQVLQLFAVTLATFNNNYSLYREGGNLFSETKSSGPPITGLANTGGKGSIASNSLEQSNVDLATEFVKMITTEKGFQANSKT